MPFEVIAVPSHLSFHLLPGRLVVVVRLDVLAVGVDEPGSSGRNYRLSTIAVHILDTFLAQLLHEVRGLLFQSLYQPQPR